MPRLSTLAKRTPQSEREQQLEARSAGNESAERGAESGGHLSQTSGHRACFRIVLSGIEQEILTMHVPDESMTPQEFAKLWEDEWNVKGAGMIRFEVPGGTTKYLNPRNDVVPLFPTVVDLSCRGRGSVLTALAVAFRQNGTVERNCGELEGGWEQPVWRPGDLQREQRETRLEAEAESRAEEKRRREEEEEEERERRRKEEEAQRQQELRNCPPRDPKAAAEDTRRVWEQRQRMRRGGRERQGPTQEQREEDKQRRQQDLLFCPPRQPQERRQASTAEGEDKVSRILQLLSGQPREPAVSSGASARQAGAATDKQGLPDQAKKVAPTQQGTSDADSAAAKKVNRVLDLLDGKPAATTAPTPVSSREAFPEEQTSSRAPAREAFPDEQAPSRAPVPAREAFPGESSRKLEREAFPKEQAPSREAFPEDEPVAKKGPGLRLPSALPRASGKQAAGVPLEEGAAANKADARETKRLTEREARLEQNRKRKELMEQKARERSGASGVTGQDLDHLTEDERRALDDELRRALNGFSVG